MRRKKTSQAEFSQRKVSERSEMSTGWPIPPTTDPLTAPYALDDVSITALKSCPLVTLCLGLATLPSVIG